MSGDDALTERAAARLHDWAARVRSNPAQVVVSVLIAALLAAGTWLAAQASGDWLQSTRLETRSMALTVEELRHLYQDQAPVALDLALLEVRADAFQDASDTVTSQGLATPGSRLAAAEAATLRKAAGELRAGLQQAGSSLLSADYERADHGYAVSTRLADALTTAGADPQGVEDAVADGDERAAWALRLAALSVVAAAAFVVLRTAGNRHRPQADPAAGSTARSASGGSSPGDGEDVGLVPQPWQERTRAQRVAAGVALVAWLLLPVLTAAQLVLSSGSARDDAESSRRATTITGSLLASQLFSSFALRSQHQQVQLGMLSLARQFVAVGDDVPGQSELASADAAAASTWAQVATAMTAPPSESDGVPPAVVAMVTSEPADYDALLAAQHEAVDSSQRRGDAANLMNLALLLAAFTTTATVLARRPGRGGATATTTAALMAGTALTIGVVAVVRTLV
ncbi:hypothetical protein [Terrabacter sp. Soil810]|uniref:hypothetical protein n=1 Tax=Terrabacter sp. Soil810 TaxID=1736418 RepID=UPI00070A2658|nr:hypothetical protein [Terrabacter sp. Soil810]KRF38912.1 hypothetical protein ASG96_16185 [Terrabacter sp. Soil810]